MKRHLRKEHSGLHANSCRRPRIITVPLVHGNHTFPFEGHVRTFPSTQACPQAHVPLQKAFPSSQACPQSHVPRGTACSQLHILRGGYVLVAPGLVGELLVLEAEPLAVHAKCPSFSDVDARDQTLSGAYHVAICEPSTARLHTHAGSQQCGVGLCKVLGSEALNGQARRPAARCCAKGLCSVGCEEKPAAHETVRDGASVGSVEQAAHWEVITVYPPQMRSSPIHDRPMNRELLKS